MTAAAEVFRLRQKSLQLYAWRWWRGLLACLQNDRRDRLNRLHPFDLLHGTDTSGYIPVRALDLPAALSASANPYAAIQPSVLRRLIEVLPAGIDLSAYDFVDLGCGKGRGLLIASEFPFQRLIGVEADPGLCAVARQNVEIIARQFPWRPPVDLIYGDAAAYEPVAKHIVLFIYNAFDATVVQRVCDQLKRRVDTGEIERVYILYHNAVHAHVFDEAGVWRRWYAASLPGLPEEHGYSFAAEGVSVVWQSVKTAIATPYVDADRAVDAISGLAEFTG